MSGARPRVYLAGPITGLTYDQTIDWRGQVATMLWPRIVAVSPMRGKAYLRDLAVIRDATDRAIGGTSKDLYDMGNVMSSPLGITGRDRNDVMNADAVLMNLLGSKKVSIGTMIEAGWSDAFRKPLVVVREKENIHAHGMLDSVALYTVEDLDEAVHLVNMLLLHY